MKRLTIFLFTLCLAVSLSGVSAYAQQNRDRRPPKQRVDAPEPRPITPKSQVPQSPDGRVNKVPRTNGERDAQFEKRVDVLLPPDMSLKQASSGFKSQGQFIAALHASKNLGIPFSVLKDKMTGPDGVSLGAAIHDIRPDIAKKDIEKHVEKAQQQAKAMQQPTS